MYVIMEIKIRNVGSSTDSRYGTREIGYSTKK